MSNDNIKVVICQRWDVFVVRDEEAANGQILDDEGFADCPSALLYAAIQAEKYGVGISYRYDR
jgi:hypothetical protein